MSKSAILVIVACAVLGAAGGFLYLRSQYANPTPTGAGAEHDHDGDGVDDHGPDARGADAEVTEHGVAVSLPADAAVCDEHHVPQAICPFCDPSLVEAHGFCGSHGVPEAYCTRCRPAVIAGFKATGDWCSDHGLPLTQCSEHGS